MNLRLLLFDLDGTLVDTGRDITNALNYALRRFGCCEYTVHETIQLIGEGTSRLIEKATGVADMSIREKVKQEFLAYYEKHLADHSSVYPDVRETLEQLSGFKKAIISNKRERLSVLLLESLDLSKHFEVVIGSDTAPERKPSPIPVLYAMQRLGVEPQETLIIGDSNYDVEAGQKAGIKTVAVTYGYKKERDLAGADYLVSRFHDILDILDSASEEYI